MFHLVTHDGLVILCIAVFRVLLGLCEWEVRFNMFRLVCFWVVMGSVGGLRRFYLSDIGVCVHRGDGRAIMCFAHSLSISFSRCPTRYKCQSFSIVVLERKYVILILACPCVKSHVHSVCRLNVGYVRNICLGSPRNVLVCVHTVG